MPVFLVLFEKWYAWRKGVYNVRTDIVSSLLSSVMNITKDVAASEKCYVYK